VDSRTISESEQETVIRVAGEVDIATAGELRDALAERAMRVTGVYEFLHADRAASDEG
jgi:anti-anti-sigma regulatory factor